MYLAKISKCVSISSICLLILAAGCAQQAKKTEVPVEVELALKFKPQTATVYKLSTLAQKSVKFEGLSADGPSFKSGQNSIKTEIVFSQQVQDVADDGTATVSITIRQLKFFTQVKENVILDFDSSGKEDKSKPLAKLIGKSYQITVSPTGTVTKVSNLKSLRAAAKGNQKVVEFFTVKAVKDRHAFLTLPKPDETLRTGQSWSKIKTFAFGLMGPREYEKVYTLKSIRNAGNHRIATVEMEAIPSAKMSEQLHKKDKTSGMTGMFDDVTESYDGLLEMDLTDGNIRKASEKLRLSWLVVDPSAKQDDKTKSASITMAVTRSYQLERID